MARRSWRLRLVGSLEERGRKVGDVVAPEFSEIVATGEDALRMAEELGHDARVGWAVVSSCAMEWEPRGPVVASMAYSLLGFGCDMARCELGEERGEVPGLLVLTLEAPLR